LSVQDFVRILTEVRGSLISQYTTLFGYSDIDLRFTSAAIQEIALAAVERGGGARALRGFMEELLLDAMYEAPGSGVRHVLVTKDVVKGVEPAFYWSRGEGAACWAAWAAEETVTQRGNEAKHL